MTRSILEQYDITRNKYLYCKHRILKLQDQLERLSNEGVVTDTVACGKKGKKALGTVKIQGVRDVSRQKTTLLQFQLQYETLEAQMCEEMKEAEDYIEAIEDKVVQMILRYRYLDGLTWNEVAVALGGDNTEDSVRKRADRHFKKEQNNDRDSKVLQQE